MIRNQWYAVLSSAGLRAGRPVGGTRLGEKREHLPAPLFFEELKTGFAYGAFRENWSARCTRAIENQLDVVHQPFVHRSTTGRGNMEYRKMRQQRMKAAGEARDGA